MEKAEPDWWKRLFDETYLVTDARSVCDEALTGREVDFLGRTLKLQKTWPILDLCGGQGRHSLELARRGFEDVSVVDYSEFLIDLGRRRSQNEGLDTCFIRCDARDTELPSDRFKVIIVMAGSFGYFVDEGENLKILREAFRLLRSGGKLLLDLPNRDYILKHFAARSWHEADEDTVVCRQRKLQGEIIHSREMVISKHKGLIRDEGYCVRLYTRERITDMLASVGFVDIQVQMDFSPHGGNGDYGCMTNRMIVIAEKRDG
jgi:D-alanine-D-alanine ligase